MKCSEHEKMPLSLSRRKQCRLRVSRNCLRALIFALIVLQISLLMINHNLTQRFDLTETEQLKVEEHEHHSVQTECKAKNHRLYPLCEEKFQFVQYFYSKSKCLKDVHGIDGSSCSILRYLTEIEPYCPSISRRKAQHLLKYGAPKYDRAKIKTDLDGVLSLMSLKDFHWLKQRVRLLWPDWQDAANLLQSNQHFRESYQKKVLIFLGSMDFQPSILKNAGKGGFVGELVQWTDLIASAYILGHHVKVVVNATNLKSILQPDEEKCASKSIQRKKIFDVIFTDLNGFGKLRGIGTSNFARLRCKIRILDSFGTEAEFNYNQNGDPIPGGESPWGGLGLILKQFLTYFPHSPDNSFLGFAGGSNIKRNSCTKKDKAVIYGKNDYYLSFYHGLQKYLNVINEYFEIHATMRISPGKKFIPSYVINHGVMKSNDLKQLLSESKVFIGLGFPFEGPGPLEAVANGAVFLNPKFDPPKNQLNDAFFKGKPNLRKVTSQNPYLENYVGEPYVHTIDIHDHSTLRSILNKVKHRTSFTNFLPREFTNIGMLERVHAFIQHQDFCDENAPRWPPLSSLEIFLAPDGVSCKHECHKRGKICEPSYFTDINVLRSFNKLGIFCKDVKKQRKRFHPSYELSTGACYVQEHYLFFSCVTEKSNVRRICPCRNFQTEQTALCESCL